MRLRISQWGAFLLGSWGATGCLAPGLPKTPGKGGPAWQEVTTEHFIVDTDLEPAAVDGLVRDLENQRNVMCEVVFGRNPPAVPRLRVLALRSDEFGSLANKYVGMFIHEAMFEPLLVTSPGGEWGTMRAAIQTHELAHYVSSLYIDSRRQPRWFSEGLAKYLETLKYDARSGKVEIGRPILNSEYFQYINQAYLDDLWDWSTTTPSESKEDQLYQTSWAVVHMLSDRRHDDLERFEDRLQHDEDPQKAWASIFPDLDRHGLSEMLGRYLGRRDFVVTKAFVPEVSVAPKARMLSDADVLGFRAIVGLALQSASSRDPAQTKKIALANVDESLKLDPASFWAHQANYYYFNKVPTSLPIAARTLDRQRESWLAWMWYFDVLTNARKPPTERREAISKALQLAPQSPPVLTRAAELEAQTGNWQRSLDLATVAVRSSGGYLESVATAANALAHLNNCGEALKVTQMIAQKRPGKLPDPVERQLAEVHAVCEGSH